MVTRCRVCIVGYHSDQQHEENFSFRLQLERELFQKQENNARASEREWKHGSI